MLGYATACSSSGTTREVVPCTAWLCHSMQTVGSATRLISTPLSWGWNRFQVPLRLPHTPKHGTGEHMHTNDVDRAALPRTCLQPILRAGVVHATPPVEPFQDNRKRLALIQDWIGAKNYGPQPALRCPGPGSRGWQSNSNPQSLQAILQPYLLQLKPVASSEGAAKGPFSSAFW